MVGPYSECDIRPCTSSSRMSKSSCSSISVRKRRHIKLDLTKGSSEVQYSGCTVQMVVQAKVSGGCVWSWLFIISNMSSGYG